MKKTRTQSTAVRSNRIVVPPSKPKGYKANFLWPPKEGSIEEAGYEFVNAQTEAYRKLAWGILLKRARRHKNHDG